MKLDLSYQMFNGMESAELQKIFIIFFCGCANNLHEAYTARRCLKLIIESTESNHTPKKIFEYRLSRCDI